jgi:uncharacterized membrane protein
MDTQKNNSISLDAIPANRRLIEELSAHQMIDDETREQGLELLYPAKNWGLWVSRLLLILGVALILSGIIYFFAFNWAKITPAMKLGSIQIAIFACLAVSYFYGLQRLSGKILLLSAAVLVGVFLAVFGQIYQAGADAYNLFMMWALLILPWVTISEFAALWIVWLVICNIFLVLYWDQAAFPASETEMMICSYLALFNGLFLGLREYFSTKSVSWLAGQWTRVVLVVPILSYIFIPTLLFVDNPSHATFSIILGALLAVVIHIAFYILYRYKLPDMWGLATTILSACIILESAIFKGITEVFDNSDAFAYLLMGCITLGIFTLAIIKLRVIANEMEEKHV